MDLFCCVYCGGRATVLDHFHPKSKGGSDEHTNLVRACGICNKNKAAHDPVEWLASHVWTKPSGVVFRRRVKRLSCGLIQPMLPIPPDEFKARFIEAVMRQLLARAVDVGDILQRAWQALGEDDAAYEHLDASFTSMRNPHLAEMWAHLEQKA